MKSKFFNNNYFNVLSQDEIDNLIDYSEWKQPFKNYSKKKKEAGMAEVLSQDEISQLLDAINAGDTDPEDFRPAGPDCRKIKIYDFKRPDKFSKEQIRTISMMHETFSRLTTTSLSAQLRSMVHVHVASVDQLTYEEFIRSIPTPTTLAIINMDPLKGNAILEIDPAITFAIIDRLCGGTGEGIQYQHELTDIETSIMEGIIVRMLGNMREAWSNIVDLRPRLGQIDTNPQFAQIVPPTDMIVLVTLEVKVGDVEGMMNVCIPYTTIECVMEKMCAQYWFNSMNYYFKRQKSEIKPELLNDVNVELRAIYFKTEMSIEKLFYILENKGIIINEGQKENTGKIYINNLIISDFELTFNAFPYKSIHTQIRLNNKNYILEKNFMSEKNNIDNFIGDLKDIKVQLIVELGRTITNLGEITGPKFGEGTILELDKLAGEPVDLFANNIKIAKGEVVVIDENFGIRVTEVLSSDIKTTYENEE